MRDCVTRPVKKKTETSYTRMNKLIQNPEEYAQMAMVDCGRGGGGAAGRSDDTEHPTSLPFKPFLKLPKTHMKHRKALRQLSRPL